MTFTLGSSRRAASQSVETSGSSVDEVMVRNPRCHSGTRVFAWTRNPEVIITRFRVRPLCGRPGMTKGILFLRLLRLELLDWPAGVAPGGESACDMRHRLQPHIIGGFRRQRRAHAAGAMKDELLVALENRLGIGAGRIDPEFQHAAGAGERPGDPSVALDLAGIA